MQGHEKEKNEVRKGRMITRLVILIFLIMSYTQLKEVNSKLSTKRIEVQKR